MRLLNVCVERETFDTLPMLKAKSGTPSKPKKNLRQKRPRPRQKHNPNPKMPAKTKSKKQVGLLLSKASPLKPAQKAKLKKELHSGAVKVKKGY